MGDKIYQMQCFTVSYGVQLKDEVLKFFSFVALLLNTLLIYQVPTSSLIIILAAQLVPRFRARSREARKAL